MWDKRTRWIHLSFIILLALSVTLGQVAINFENYTPPDAFDYAQLARNLAETGTFQTDVITPLSWSKTPNLHNHPDLWRAPVYPLLVALGFQIAGVGELVPVAVSILSYLVFLIICYLIVEHLSGSRAALYSTLLLLSYGLLARAGVSALSESTYLMVAFLSLLVVLQPEDHPLLFGGLSALAYLTRYNHWFLLIGFFYVALQSCRQEKLRYTLLSVKTFLVVISPWLIRNVYHVGLPFYHHHTYLLSAHNPINPQFDVFFQFNPVNPFWFALTHPVVMVQKSLTNLFQLYRWIPRFFTGAWPVGLLAVWNLTVPDKPKTTLWRLVLIGFGLGFLLQALGLSFVHLKSRHYISFLPVVFFLAGDQLSRLHRFRRFVAVGLAGLLVTLSLIGWFRLDPWGASLTPSDYRAIKQHIPADEPILTNAPELTAWYTGRSSLWLAPYGEAKAHYPPFKYVLLTPEVNRNYSPRISIRNSYLENQMFRREFRLIKTFDQSKSRLYRAVADQSSE